LTIIYLTSAWLAGILLSPALPPLAWLPLAACPPLVAIAVLWRQEPRVWLPALCALLFVLGGARHVIAQPTVDEGFIAFFNDGGEVTLQGLVADNPDPGDRYTNLRLRTELLQMGEQWLPVRGDVLLRTPTYLSHSYGDRLEVRGNMRTPPDYPDFSYREYLARRGIHAIIDYPHINLLEHNRGHPLWAALRGIQLQGQKVISRILPQPQAALLAGILLGIESGIPRDLMDQFNATGTTHIIVISGFNIAIIAGFLSRWGRRIMGARGAAVFAIAGIALYTLLVGAYPAVVRAAIMGGLSLLALLAGRQAWALNSLTIAAFLMTANDPMVLWDVGFQLSFAASLGLIMFVRPLNEWLERRLAGRLPPDSARGALRFLDEALIITLAAQVLTLPIILHNFGRLPLIAPLSNFLILPAQPGLMLSGALATILGLVSLPLGQAAGWIAWLFTTYTIRMVELTARIPFASVDVGRPGLPVTAAYYGVAGLGARLLKLEPSRRRAVWDRVAARWPLKATLVGLALASVLVWTAALSLPDGRLHVSLLNVGQGDAIFIVTPGGRQILVDGGPSPTLLPASLGRRMPFWDRSLDVVVLTHPDEDHAAGLVPILERYRADLILGTDLPHDAGSSRRWKELLEERNLPVSTAQKGMRLDMGEALYLEVLHPPREPMEGTDADDNNNSIVLRLLYGQTSILLTGDIQAEAEEELLSSGQALAAQVLKVSHHGAGQATTSRFLQAVGPAHAVVSVGEGNRFGHPHPDTLARLEDAGIAVWRTDLQGTIEVVSDGLNLWIEAEE
jgi:competence protein ComEC